MFIIFQDRTLDRNRKAGLVQFVCYTRTLLHVNMSFLKQNSASITPLLTPNIVEKKMTEHLKPDTEENVGHQTESIFRNFVFYRYTKEVEKEKEYDTPCMPELTAFTDNPLSYVKHQLSILKSSLSKFVLRLNHSV